MENSNEPTPVPLAIDASYDGARLDHALALLFPGLGLRRLRRVWETHLVLVNGTAREASYRVHQGQVLGVEPFESTPETSAPVLTIVGQSERFAAVLKPCGMHSAAIAGRDNPTAEAQLAGLFPGFFPQLLNRLDYLTSGLLLVALDQGAAQLYQSLDGTAVEKQYRAVVHGHLDGFRVLRRVLDAADRKKTRVLRDEVPEEDGWTWVYPDSPLADGLATLVRVNIARGARHQIRAHLAAAGHPILGDPLYGVPGDGASRLYLHHDRIAFPGFEAESPATWPLEADLGNVARAAGR